MVYFKLKHSAAGAGIWGIIMGMAVTMMYLPLMQYREVILTVLFPIILSLLSQQKHFNVNLSVITTASIMAFVYTLLLRINKNARGAQEKPFVDKELSAVVYSSTVLCFMISIILASLVFPIYDYKATTI